MSPSNPVRNTGGFLVIKFSWSYSRGVPTEPARRWTIKTTADVREWLRALRQTDPETYRSVNVAIDMLAEVGPGLGRP